MSRSGAWSCGSDGMLPAEVHHLASKFAAMWRALIGSGGIYSAEELPTAGGGACAVQCGMR